MATTKAFEMKTLVGKSLKELVKLRNTLRRELYDLKLKNSLRALTQTHLVKIVRRNIARINTAITVKNTQK